MVRRKIESRRCRKCGKEFYVHPNKPDKYCSFECYSKMDLGRKNKIVQLREDGLTYREIAEKFGVSFQRIHQICSGQ